MSVAKKIDIIGFISDMATELRDTHKPSALFMQLFKLLPLYTFAKEKEYKHGLKMSAILMELLLSEKMGSEDRKEIERYFFL